MVPMTLLALAEGAVAEICALTGDAGVTRRMQDLGLFAGRTVRLVRAAPFSGPLLVEEQRTGARVMIARAIAVHIQVLDAGAPGR
jgi:Fe2+ transport system protein FeoA